MTISVVKAMSFNCEGKTWKQHVEDACRQVKGGQHLRFINMLYRTKEICLIAVKYDTRSGHVRDLGCVPAGNLDYVWDKLQEDQGGYSLHEIEEAFREKRDDIAKPGYFDDGITCWQDLLKEHNATDYDDYLEKRFNHLTEEATKIRSTDEWKESDEGKRVMFLGF